MVRFGRVRAGVAIGATVMALATSCVSDLGVPGNAVAHGVSSNGWIVGRSDSSAFLRDPGGTVRVLNVAPDGLDAVNSSGVAVGTVNGGCGTNCLYPGAVKWDGQAIVHLEGFPSAAGDINDGGTIVGFVYDGGYQAAVWPPSGPPRYLPVQNPSSVNGAHGVNEAGDVVGRVADAAGTEHAAYWDAATSTLHVLSDRRSWAWEINDDGVIAGVVFGDDGKMHAARWAAGSHELTVLDEAESEARAVNNAGVVVGWREADGPASRRAMSWSPTGEATNLGSYDGPSRAADINDAGTIVGSAVQGTISKAVTF
jgi:hypothetical protein